MTEMIKEKRRRAARSKARAHLIADLALIIIIIYFAFFAIGVIVECLSK